MPRVSRLRRLLGRVSAAPERLAAGDRDREREEKSPAPEAEVGSAGLDRMVRSFMEDAATPAVERGPPPRAGRCGNCCFNGSAANSDGSDDEDEELVFDFLPSISGQSASSAAVGDTLEALKGLVQSTSLAERNLLADASRVAERCRGGGKQQQKKKGDLRLAVADGLRALGHDAAVCKSRWDKAPSFPAGEHEYIDAMVESEFELDAARLIVEVDFRAEFEVARPTKAYRAVLQALPAVFVGTPDRLGRIVAVVAEAARQSLRKKGLSFPPWRKPEYMRAKWLSPHARCSSGLDKQQQHPPSTPAATPVSAASFTGEFELRFDGETTKGHDSGGGGAQKITVVVSPWRPLEPEVTRKKRPVIAGLTSVL